MKIRLIILSIFVLLWWVVSIFTENHILSSPFYVMTVIIRMLNYELIDTIYFSFIRLFIGYMISLITSILLAIISKKNDMILKVIEIVSSSMLKVPNIAYLTMFMIFIGVGTPTVIATIIVSLVPTMTLSFLSIFKQINRHIEDISDIFNIPFAKRAIYFYFPTLMESFYPIFTMTFSLGFKLMVMAEFVAGTNGLGYRLVEKKMSFNMDEVIAYVIIIVIVGVFLQKIFEFVYRRFRIWIL